MSFVGERLQNRGEKIKFIGFPLGTFNDSRINSESIELMGLRNYVSNELFRCYLKKNDQIYPETSFGFFDQIRLLGSEKPNVIYTF